MPLCPWSRWLLNWCNRQIDSIAQWLTIWLVNCHREGAGRELHEQGEESSAVFSGLQGNSTLSPGRYSWWQVPNLHDRWFPISPTIFSCVLSSSTVNLQHELSSPSHGNYLSGPTLHTLCTVLVDLDKETVTIYKGNPKNGEMALVLPMLWN